MNVYTGKVDEAVLAALYPTFHDHGCAGKGSDRGAVARPQRKVFIEAPVAGPALVDEVAQ